MDLGDFSALAKDYINRPSYDADLIDEIISRTGLQPPNIVVADVGAGTGKLTKVLAHVLKGEGRIYAIEPNDAMRSEGIKYTKAEPSIEWSKGSGENTNLTDRSVDWVTMASSFHWTDPRRSLPEFRRILESAGFLSIM
jgi:ubiquinone/menaquinone biosynthesis C-methylase UbiE